jgi:hypothetical protein
MSMSSTLKQGRTFDMKRPIRRSPVLGQKYCNFIVTICRCQDEKCYAIIMVVVRGLS